MGWERWLCQISKSNFSVVWPWLLTSWSQKLTVSPPYPGGRRPVVLIFSKICSSICEILYLHCDIDLWPPHPKSWPFHLHVPQTTFAKCSTIGTFIFNSVFTSLVAHYWANGKVKNITPPASRTSWRHKITHSKQVGFNVPLDIL